MAYPFTGVVLMDGEFTARETMARWLSSHDDSVQTARVGNAALVPLFSTRAEALAMETSVACLSKVKVTGVV